MKRTKKKVLGIAGLAAVGIMTAVACGMPAPDASAKEANTTVNVQVSEGTPSNTFITPSDGSETTNGIVEVTTNYSQAKTLDFYLSYTDANGTVQRVDLPSYTPTDDAGVYKFNIDVTPYGFNNFEIHALVTGYDNVSRETDTVSFNYTAVVVTPDPGQTGGDPSVDIEINDEVDKIIITIFDEKGNQVKDKNGNDIVIEADRSAIDPATGKVHINIPLGDYGVPAGDYTGIASAYNKAGNLISMTPFKISYRPATPDTPNTGMLSIGDLNISRIDYLVTGLIAFVVATGVAIALIYRRSRR